MSQKDPIQKVLDSNEWSADLRSPQARSKLAAAIRHELSLAVYVESAPYSATDAQAARIYVEDMARKRAYATSQTFDSVPCICAFEVGAKWGRDRMLITGIEGWKTAVLAEMDRRQQCWGDEFLPGDDTQAGVEFALAEIAKRLVGQDRPAAIYVPVEEALPPKYHDVFVLLKDETRHVGRLNHAGKWERASYQQTRYQYTIEHGEVVAWCASPEGVAAIRKPSPADVWIHLLRCLSADNGALFSTSYGDFSRASAALQELIDAGFFLGDPDDIDGDHWQAAAGEQGEAAARFSRKAQAYQVLSDVLNQVFERVGDA